MPYEKDTICAISTPPGSGGIGIVRLSGPDAVEVASRIIRLKHGIVGDIPNINAIKYGWVVYSSGNAVDEAMVSVMRAPHTYTREDVVEINCHGGQAVLNAVLALACSAGARLAEPGEFTKRAFLNGRIDLTQAEAVMDVIAAGADASLRSAMDQLAGGLGDRVDSLRQQIAEALALTEASIDFPEEEIEYVPLDGLTKRADEILAGLRALIATYDEGRILREGLRVAIIGRPNVGKSSLLNRLAGMERAIVTEVPGTTRDTVEEMISLSGIPVLVVDTAGIRHSEDVVEVEGIKRSEAAMRSADLVLLVVDGSLPLTDEDMRLITKLDGERYIPVVNKSDLPRAGDSDAAFGEVRPVYISAKRGDGLDELTSRVREFALGGRAEAVPQAAINLRHKTALVRAESALARFGEGVRDKLSPEFLALELREALDAVGEVVGATTPDDVLNIIFSRFCIGK